jgi:hypothetical protein
MGTLSEANCSSGGVSVNSTQIIWLPAVTPGVTGCIDTGTSTSLTYSGGTLGPGVMGTIMDLTLGEGIVNNFMNFSGTTLDFVLDGFTAPAATNGTNCASTTSGQTCLVTSNSPFLLENLGNGQTEVTLTAFGTIVDGGVTSNWSGGFGTTLNFTPASIQGTILTGGSENSTNNATFFVTATPEPATFTMIGMGLIGLAMAAKRRKTRT